MKKILLRLALIPLSLAIVPLSMIIGILLWVCTGRPAFKATENYLHFLEKL